MCVRITSSSSRWWAWPHRRARLIPRSPHLPPLSSLSARAPWLRLLHSAWSLKPPISFLWARLQVPRLPPRQGLRAEICSSLLSQALGAGNRAHGSSCLSRITPPLAFHISTAPPVRARDLRVLRGEHHSQHSNPIRSDSILSSTYSSLPSANRCSTGSHRTSIIM